MTTFDDLHQRKIVLAAALVKKLLEMRPQLFAAEQMGKKEFVRDWLLQYAGLLRDLVKLASAQKDLCKNDQCNTLLDQELAELKVAIRHIEQVAAGGDLDESKIRDALATIASREHSLPMLLKAA